MTQGAPRYSEEAEGRGGEEKWRKGERREGEVKRLRLGEEGKRE